jgi:hypothetical protein
VYGGQTVYYVIARKIYIVYQEKIVTECALSIGVHIASVASGNREWYKVPGAAPDSSNIETL